jgi:hypothetical protein
MTTVAIPAWNSLGLLLPIDPDFSASPDWSAVMNQQEHLQLLAERKFLQLRLVELPVSARIMRISTESRLTSIKGHAVSNFTEKERNYADVKH